ncbi:MAG: carboxylating nicotinate-nucleotide diphosphorylase [Flavobacteriales bacterium]
MNMQDFILNSLREDIGNGDHTSLACILPDHTSSAQLECRERGVIAGIDVAEKIFKTLDASLCFERKKADGDRLAPGDVAFYVEGISHSILKAERLVLNCMQRMSGIATFTRKVLNELEGLHTKLLDTRKTTPGMRMLEKEAVRLGGGCNHRHGLYDMMMIKDNHIDCAGSIEKALKAALAYRQRNKLDIEIEIEARNLDEVKQIIRAEGADRIMLDNFTIPETKAALKMIGGRIVTESSGCIGLHNVRQYAECGVDYISMGALTHSVKSLDLGLKTI